jgi:hypothetical protein
MIASIAIVLSSVSVSTNALRLRAPAVAAAHIDRVTPAGSKAPFSQRDCQVHPCLTIWCRALSVHRRDD